MKLRIAWICFPLLVSGCPQLLDDDFRSGEELSGGSGAANGGATNIVVAGGGAGGSAAEAGAGGSVADATTRGLGVDASVGGTASQGACSEGRQRGPRGDCYVVIPEAVTWQAGRTNCLTEGAGWDLATVRSPADTDFIVPLLGAELWIGASDAVDEGTWLWIASGDQFWPEGADSGGSAAAYTNWNAGEPNNVDGADCLRLLTTGKWADLPCDSALGSLCAGPPAQ
jgi:hypothetical protein